jgi:peptidoglycan hydrolase-like protein with peptidoglycan-binding domain
MADYIYAVQTIKYGTPTGSNTMPASGAMVTLPDTVKGSIAIEETEFSLQKFFTDQKLDPVQILKTEEGAFTVVAQFYDMTVGAIAALKGGTAVTGATNSYTPAVGFSTISKAIAIAFESGHTLNLYNATVLARIVGNGARDKMMTWEVKFMPQISADLAGAWGYTKP